MEPEQAQPKPQENPTPAKESPADAIPTLSNLQEAVAYAFSDEYAAHRSRNRK